MVLINFGLKVNDGTDRVLAWGPVLISFMSAAPGAELVGIADSDTEPTLIMRAERAPDEAAADRLCRKFRQDCFAVYDEGSREGRLVGPEARRWGSFNPEYFLVDGSGRRLLEVA